MAAKRLTLGVMVSSKDVWELSQGLCQFAELLLFADDGPDIIDKILSTERNDEVLQKLRYVHAQEFMRLNGAKVLVDLSSADDGVRSASVDAVMMARDVADSLGGLPVVIHPGGIRNEVSLKDSLLSNLERSLKELGTNRLLLENMPWFYWYEKKDRRYSNVCVSVEDMKRLSGLVDGFTLDVCHGYLSRPEGDQGYSRRFMQALGPKVRHIHVSDARAPDSEGLQIGEGEVDFSFLKDVDVPITVEIWGGHVSGGKGFRLGIERLRTLDRCWHAGSEDGKRKRQIHRRP